MRPFPPARRVSRSAWRASTWDRASSATELARFPIPTDAVPGFITGAAPARRRPASFSTVGRSVAISSGMRKTADAERTSVSAPGSRERIKPLSAVTLQPAGQHLLDEVAAQPAFDLGRRALLRQLEGQHRRTVLQGAPPAMGVDRLLIDRHR